MKVKSILSGILIGTVTVPTLAMGGSFVSSLIAGKTPAEAVEVLAAQIDSLIGRVEVIESKQSKAELWQEKEDVCNKARDFMSANMPTGYEWFLITISHRENDITRLEAKINYPDCQKCSDEDEDCKSLVYQQQGEGKCATDEDRESHKQHLETNVRPELSRLISIKEQYLLLKQECDDLTTRYNSL